MGEFTEEQALHAASVEAELAVVQGVLEALHSELGLAFMDASLPAPRLILMQASVAHTLSIVRRSQQSLASIGQS